MISKSAKIFVAGHNGMVGSAIYRKLYLEGFRDVITRSRQELDLTDSKAVSHFFDTEKPEYVILAAARVGGIMANNIYRADFLIDNLSIQNNVIKSAFKTGSKKLIFLGSSCIYPRNSKQPIKEEYLLTDILEYTNEPYAIAKIAGLKLCESYNLQHGTNFISAMPTNLYGPNDNYDLENSHVLPALIRKMLLAKWYKENNWEALKKDFVVRPYKKMKSESNEEIIQILEKIGIEKSDGKVTLSLWGTGSPKREFLHVDDLASAIVFLLEKIDFQDIVDMKNPGKEIRNTHINVGSGQDLSIKELSNLVKKHTGFDGEIHWNIEFPDGTPRKLMDSSSLNNLGWTPLISLEDGISETINTYAKY